MIDFLLLLFFCVYNTQYITAVMTDVKNKLGGIDMVLERLEALPVGSFHYKLLLVTGLGWLFDSMDTGLIAFILPVLAKEWQLAPGQMGLIGSIGLIGMALGLLYPGPLPIIWDGRKFFDNRTFI